MTSAVTSSGYGSILEWCTPALCGRGTLTTTWSGPSWPSWSGTPPSGRVDGVSRVLDVGCGWGAMLHYLVGERQVRHVTGLTLSSDQWAATASGPKWKSGSRTGGTTSRPLPTTPSCRSAHSSTLPARNCRERNDEPFTAVFSTGAQLWLHEGGRLSLQSIAYEDFDPSTGPVSSFFSEEIFPESALPQLSDIVEAAEGKFRLVAFRNDPQHYEHTLRLWQRRLEANKAQASQLVGRETYRRYLRYLRVSRAMFERRVCTLYRVVFERRSTNRCGIARDDTPTERNTGRVCGQSVGPPFGPRKGVVPARVGPMGAWPQFVHGERRRRRRDRLSPRVSSALFVNLLTEDNLPHYYHVIAEAIGQDSALAGVDPPVGR